MKLKINNTYLFELICKGLKSDYEYTGNIVYMTHHKKRCDMTGIIADEWHLELDEKLNLHREEK